MDELERKGYAVVLKRAIDGRPLGLKVLSVHDTEREAVEAIPIATQNPWGIQYTYHIVKWEPCK